MKAITLAIAIALGMAIAITANAQLPFFPGAEGFGGAFSGTAPAGGWFSNATIYRVTNLNDSGPGSFRNAFQENTANRIVIFDVAGTINLTSGPVSIKNLANYYIAGQTAPGPVTIYGNTVQLSHSSGKQNRNVVLRYLSFRKGTGDGEDSLTFSGGGLGTNLILDHVSASWSEDEILSVANNNTNVTVQYAMINDALINDHAYGSLIRPQIDSNVSFHHNLYANNASRQARFGTYNAETLTADFRNNVVYNWRDRASYAGGSGDPQREFADVNYVGNYLIAGPGTTGSATRAFSVDKNIDVRVFQSGNYIDSDRQLNPDGVPNGADRGWSAFGFGGLGSPVQTLTQMASPFPTAPVATQTAPDAYRQVVDDVGNWWWDRDAIDARVISNVQNNTGPPIGAAAPNATELANLLAAPMSTHPAGSDSDNDGMPNAWELAHGLNPSSAAGSPDWKLDFDHDGYINLIEYINERGEFRAPAEIFFHGGANARYAEITNWRTSFDPARGSPWQPSKFDDAFITEGSVVVDAVGQHAKALRVASASETAATLNVTAGWLDLAESLLVGEAGVGVVNHSGGRVRTDQVLLGGPFAGTSGTYNLSGSGVLQTEYIDLASNLDAFNFTGGVLSADVVDFDLVNQGGTIAPGNESAWTRVRGDLTLSSGALEIRIGGAGLGQYGRVEVDGLTTLGGTLKVELIDLGGGAYAPQLGDAFDIIAAFGGAAGAFESFDLPQLAPGLAWAISPKNASILLSVISTNGDAADFNRDGVVDGEDLVIWRQGLGAAGQTNNASGDADADGDVDGADLLAWQRNLSPVVVGPAHGVVPEPSAVWLAMTASLLCSRRIGKVRIWVAA
ncbi:MAG TPA: dockerin type I domain-containing protein [Lacipirellula sp.]